jgi:hypothetical protein
MTRPARFGRGFPLRGAIFVFSEDIMLELLSPAGSPEAVYRRRASRAADAVYLGYGNFNAAAMQKTFREDLRRRFLIAVSGVRRFTSP